MKGRFSGPSHDLKRSRNLHSMPQFHAFHASFIASPYDAEVSDVDIGMKFEVASNPLEADDEAAVVPAAVVPDTEVNVKVLNHLPFCCLQTTF